MEYRPLLAEQQDLPTVVLHSCRPAQVSYLLPIGSLVNGMPYNVPTILENAVQVEQGCCVGTRCNLVLITISRVMLEMVVQSSLSMPLYTNLRIRNACSRLAIDGSYARVVAIGADAFINGNSVIESVVGLSV